MAFAVLLAFRAVRERAFWQLWPASHPAAGRCHGGSQGGGHFTSLAQITAANVDRLQEVWVYRTGDFSPGAPGHRATTFEATPILAHDTLYFCTPYNRVIALRAESGKLIWSHEPEPKLDRAYDKQHSLICRGVSYLGGTGARSEQTVPGPYLPGCS